MIKVNDQEFIQMRALIYDLTGIFLEEEKKYLVESRFSDMLKGMGCESFGEFYYKVGQSSDPFIRNQIINAITTNETLFFRDNTPFQALQFKILPDVIDHKNRKAGPYARQINIWSAACSTGQEVYSIAITICELLPDLSKWDVRIMGTDVSDAAIASASYGLYSDFELQRGMSQERMNKYFKRENAKWRVRDEIRCLTSFKRANLLWHDLDVTGPFDIIFCRNVAIYFNAADKKKLFAVVEKRLAPHGWLFVGSSESLMNITPQFKAQYHMNAAVYQLS